MDNNAFHFLKFQSHDVIKTITVLTLLFLGNSSLIPLLSHTFRKAFKEIHGKPIYQWYKEYRLEYSLGLLINTDIPIIEIANEIGYSNPSKYSAAFYQYTSMTPQQYRKSHLKMEQ